MFGVFVFGNRHTMAVKKTKLNPKQELFCHLFARDGECIGNATKAYVEAYDLTDSHKSWARRCASRLLTKADIRRRVAELLDECLDARVVDRELVKTLLQNKDLGAKVSAIKEYNRLKDRASDRLEGEFIFRWVDGPKKS